MSLSIVMPYYRNPRMLARHLQLWRDDWPTSLKAQVEIVLVDDGSPSETAREVLQGQGTENLPALSLYRVTEDRLWHQHGARNLGAHVAKGDWLLMTDMDHMIPTSTLEAALAILLQANENAVLTFGRVDAPANTAWRPDDWREFKRSVREDGSLKPHVNSFVISHTAYWKLGGYDEELCGIYGTDGNFIKRMCRGCRVVHLHNSPLVRVDRDVIDDASTRDTARKETPGRIEARAKILRDKYLAKRGIVSLDFPWERVL